MKNIVLLIFIQQLFFIPVVEAQIPPDKYKDYKLVDCTACENSLVSTLELKYNAGIDSVYFAHLDCSGMILYQVFVYVHLDDTIRKKVLKTPDSLYIYEHAPLEKDVVVDISNLVHMNGICYFPILSKFTLDPQDKTISDKVSKSVGNKNPNVSFYPIEDLNGFILKQKKRGRMVYVLWKTIIEK